VHGKLSGIRTFRAPGSYLPGYIPPATITQNVKKFANNNIILELGLWSELRSDGARIYNLGRLRPSAEGAKIEALKMMKKRGMGGGFPSPADYEV